MKGPLAPALAARLRALPAGPKLLALMCAATALLLTRSPWPLAAAFLLALGLALLAVGPGRLATAASWALALTIGGVALLTLVFEGPAPGLAVLFRLLALILLAQVVTDTTRASAVQDALVRALEPFERLPFVSAAKTGLALAIALRSVPRLGSALRDLREAREARGLAVAPYRLVLPLIARILRDAREMADAIDARSWTSTRGPR